ncbi:MAG: hypothetical protein Q9213_004615 [Squamulea squamosa]
MASRIRPSMIRFLSLEQVKKLHQIYIGTTAPCGDILLGSAINAPMNTQHYEGEQDVVKLASILASRIIKNHPFMDGNKRTALLAANAFLKINGKMLQERPHATLDAAHKAFTVGELDEAGLAKEYGKVVVDSPVTLEMQRMSEDTLDA